MGGSIDDVDGFVVCESDREAATLTVYWGQGKRARIADGYAASGGELGAAADERMVAIAQESAETRPDHRR